MYSATSSAVAISLLYDVCEEVLDRIDEVLEFRWATLSLVTERAQAHAHLWKGPKCLKC